MPVFKLNDFQEEYHPFYPFRDDLREAKGNREVRLIKTLKNLSIREKFRSGARNRRISQAYFKRICDDRAYYNGRKINN